METEEAQLSEHIHNLLEDYVRQHLTTDHAEYTRLAVSELINREKVPLQDPQCLTLPKEPFDLFASSHKLNELEPFDEKLVITRDAQTYLRDVLQKSKGKARSERLNFACFTNQQDDEFEDFQPILTRKAMRETPNLGSRMEKAENGQYLCKIPQTEAKTYPEFVKEKLESVQVEPVEEQPTNKDKTLDVVFQLRAEDEQDVRTLLKSVIAIRGAPKKQGILKKVDEWRSFLPARLQQMPAEKKEATPPPDSPPLMPLFPRNQPLEKRGVKRKLSIVDGLPVMPESISDLPAILGVPKSKERKLFPDDDEFSAEEISKQNMMVVDGWTTFATSSPSPLPSLDGDDDNIDQLLGMFPSSPDTELSAFMNMAEEIENSKMDPVLIPRSRCIGGDLSTEGNGEEVTRPMDVGTFLSSLLGPKQDPDVLAKYHPVLSRQISSLPDSTLVENGPEGSIQEEQNAETASLLGQPAFSVLDVLKPSPVSADMNRILSEDEEIRSIYASAALGVTKGLNSPLAQADPLDFIRNEPLFDENMEVDEPTSGIKENDAILRIELLPVPLLHEPTSHVRDRLPSKIADMLAPTKDALAAHPESETDHLKFLRKVKKGLAPLRIELSWVPFNVPNPPPNRDQLLGIDSVYDDDWPTAILKPRVDHLLQSANGSNDATSTPEVEEKILQKLRSIALREEADTHPKDQFSAEIARCELLMTRGERWRLHGLDDLDEERSDGDNEDDQTGKAQTQDREDDLPGGRPSSVSAGLSFKTAVRPSDICNSGCLSQVSGEAEHRIPSRLSSPSHLSDPTADGEPFPEPRDEADYYYADALEDDTMVDPNIISSSTIATDMEDTYIFQDEAEERTTSICPSNNLEHDTGSLTHRTQYYNRTQSSAAQEICPTTRYQDIVSDYHRPEQPFTDFDNPESELRHPTRPRQQHDIVPADEHSISRSLNVSTEMDQDPFFSQVNQAPTLLHPKPRSSTMPTNLLTSQTSQAYSLEMFTKLRAKTIKSTNIANQAPSSPAQAVTHITQTEEATEEPTLPHSRSCPPELITADTLQLPDHQHPPFTRHKYLSSLELLQKRALVKALQDSNCQVELVERDSLTGVDLIIDPYTAIVFAPLLSLPAQAKDLIAKLSAETWRYSRILIVFEAYPSSRSFKSKDSNGLVEVVQPEVYAYTPPVLKAVKKFRRDLGIAEACASRSSRCEVWLAFADSVGEATAYARMFGDYAEANDVTEGALWGEREWLDMEPAEEEAPLAMFNGMNHFAAAIILCQVSFEQLLGLSCQERMDQFSPYIGIESMDMLNEEIQRRLRVIDDAEASMSALE